MSTYIYHIDNLQYVTGILDKLCRRYAGEILARAGVPQRGNQVPPPPSSREMQSRIKLAASAVDRAAADAKAARGTGRSLLTEAREGFVSPSYKSGALHAFHSGRGLPGASGRRPQSALADAYVLNKPEITKEMSGDLIPRGKVRQPARALPRPSELASTGKHNGFHKPASSNHPADDQAKESGPGEKERDYNSSGALDRVLDFSPFAPAAGTGRSIMRAGSMKPVNGTGSGYSKSGEGLSKLPLGDGDQKVIMGPSKVVEHSLSRAPPTRVTPQSRYIGIQERLGSLKGPAAEK